MTDLDLIEIKKKRKKKKKLTFLAIADLVYIPKINSYGDTPTWKL